MVPVEKGDFTPRSTLMASPIIFQTRAKRTATCPFNYSSHFIANQHSKALDSKCSDPFVCEERVSQSPEAVMACLGEPEENATVAQRKRGAWRGRGRGRGLWQWQWQWLWRRGGGAEGWWAMAGG